MLWIKCIVISYNIYMYIFTYNNKYYNTCGFGWYWHSVRNAVNVTTEIE